MICLTCGREYGIKRKFNFIRECDKCKIKHEQEKRIDIRPLVLV